MAKTGGGNPQINTEAEIITLIAQVQDELERLGIRRERENFRLWSDEQLEEFLENKRDQMLTRKKFLGLDNTTEEKR